MWRPGDARIPRATPGPGVPGESAWGSLVVLDGIRVVDLSTEIAGPYCTKLLADAGADVVKVEPPGGDPLRRSGSGALYEFLNTSKRSVAGSPSDPEAQALLAAADVVVASEPFDDAALRQANPALVTVVVTPFGEDGPWAGWAATEFTLQAWCGSTGSRGRAGGTAARRRRPHRRVDGGHVRGRRRARHCLAGRAHRPRRARRRRDARRDDRHHEHVHGGVRVVPRLAGAATADAYDRDPLDRAVRRRLLPSSPRTARSSGPTSSSSSAAPSCSRTGPRVVRGAVAQAERSVGTDPRAHEAALDRRAVGAGGTAPRPERTGRQRRDGHGLRPLRRAGNVRRTPERPFRAAACPLPDLRLAVAPVRPGRRARRAQRHDRVAARPAPVRDPGVPAGVPAGAPVPLPLDGVRVVDTTAWWAGPAATHMLAALGADVIKVESVGRPDLMRYSSTRPPTEDQWWEWGPVFHGANNSKRGITLDLTRPEGVTLLKRLVATADVLLENFTPRVMDNFGLGWDALHAVNPRLVMTRMPAYGLDGPWRDRTGFAQTMEAITGMAWVTGWPDGPPVLPRGACDPLAATPRRLRDDARVARPRDDRRRPAVEVTMVEAALNMAAEQVVEYGASGTVLARHGNRGPAAAPQNVYACAGDEEWIALAVATDEQWTPPARSARRPRLGARPAAHDRRRPPRRSRPDRRRARGVVRRAGRAGGPRNGSRPAASPRATCRRPRHRPQPADGPPRLLRDRRTTR